MPSSTSRRRGEALERAIFRAVLDELAEVGYQKLTMEGVAVRANTSKPVLYRRWPSRPALVLAALGHDAPTAGELPDTGALRSDLIALLQRLVHRFDHVPGTVLVGLITETARDPELSAELRARFADRPVETLVLELARRAAARGELGPRRPPDRVARVPFDLLRNEYLRQGVPDDDLVIEIVDDIVLPLLHEHSRR
ncbi:TetR/AcrR family transcriptional regulator [Nocardia terpenica]|uniref:TetR family transcriptional regulator n=1 Tax=Nocardia terpenica TaxID=455432 RepID=A0A291RNC0_9NOCA|nr:TetR/AcrR family transcriptional regulator [Nocardia terpenica]ATL68805.1 TetR family transcriptional regulator [Nocardia terpenica]